MKPHHSEAAEKALKEEGEKKSPWAQQSGVKIIINVGGPPTPMMLPIGKPPTKLLKKKLKKKKPRAKGPMEAALSGVG